MQYVLHLGQMGEVDRRKGVVADGLVLFGPRAGDDQPPEHHHHPAALVVDGADDLVLRVGAAAELPDHQRACPARADQQGPPLAAVDVIGADPPEEPVGEPEHGGEDEQQHTIQHREAPGERDQVGDDGQELGDHDRHGGGEDPHQFIRAGKAPQAAVQAGDPKGPHGQGGVDQGPVLIVHPEAAAGQQVHVEFKSNEQGQERGQVDRDHVQRDQQGQP